MASAQRLQQLRTGAILAALPEPLLSSRSRGWNGIVVELQRFHDIDALVQMPEHVVAVHIAGSIDLLQRRYGKSCRRTIGPGDVIITPVGEPTYWQHAGDNVVVLLRLDADFVCEVARDELEIDPSRLELQDNLRVADRATRRHLLALIQEATNIRIARYPTGDPPRAASLGGCDDRGSDRGLAAQADALVDISRTTFARADLRGIAQTLALVMA
jgi:hypothetical protein